MALNRLVLFRSDVALRHTYVEVKAFFALARRPQRNHGNVASA